MKKEIKTRQQLIERLNEIDRRCIDSNRHFHDLRTLFEAKEYKLSAQDKADIKKVASIEDDPDTLKAYIDSKAIEEDFEQDWDPEDYAGGYTEWDLIDSKKTAEGENYNLWYNEFNGRWVCTSGDSDVYYPENAPEYDAEFEDEDEAREWFEDYTGGSYKDVNEEVDLNSYNDGYVELRDGKPQFVYSTLRDAKDGMFWSQMGDSEHGLGKHSYEIKKWENGVLKDLDESHTPRVVEFGKEMYYDSPAQGTVSNISELNVGDRVHHSSYNLGTVDKVKDNKVYVRFDDYKGTRIFPGSAIQYLSKVIDESYEDGEYDYFVVYKGKIMQGEYPTYEEAKKNADKDCIIKGVIQYGGSEFEETEIKESLTEDIGEYKEFEYELTLYIDTYSQDDYFDYNEFDYIDTDDIQHSLSSYIDNIKSIFTEFDFELIEEDTERNTIIYTLYVDVPTDSNITEEQLRTDIRKHINKWSYTAAEEVSEQTDVDDFITHYIDVEAYADIDLK